MQPAGSGHASSSADAPVIPRQRGEVPRGARQGANCHHGSLAADRGGPAGEAYALREPDVPAGLDSPGAATASADARHGGRACRPPHAPARVADRRRRSSAASPGLPCSSRRADRAAGERVARSTSTRGARARAAVALRRAARRVLPRRGRPDRQPAPGRHVTVARHRRGAVAVGARDRRLEAGATLHGACPPIPGRSEDDRGHAAPSGANKVRGKATAEAPTMSKVAAPADATESRPHRAPSARVRTAVRRESRTGLGPVSVGLLLAAAAIVVHGRSSGAGTRLSRPHAHGSIADAGAPPEGRERSGRPGRGAGSRRCARDAPRAAGPDRHDDLQVALELRLGAARADDHPGPSRGGSAGRRWAAARRRPGRGPRAGTTARPASAAGGASRRRRMRPRSRTGPRPAPRAGRSRAPRARRRGRRAGRCSVRPCALSTAASSATSSAAVTPSLSRTRCGRRSSRAPPRSRSAARRRAAIHLKPVSVSS